MRHYSFAERSRKTGVSKVQIRRFILFVILAILSAGCFCTARAQYYSWGDSPASIKWNQLKTPDIKLIYPASFQENGRRALWYFDTIRHHINFGYRLGTMPTPVILHTQNMVGNGMVMWAPKRIELLSAPGSTYSDPWLKQLVIHEYRHNVQYNNLNQSTMKALGWILGDQAKFLGPALFGVLLLEGDAVMFETEMSAFGRGLQPSFTMHYRATGDVGDPHYAKDYWFCGSYRTFVPDHYCLGYQMVRWSYNHYDEFIFDKLAWFTARNPYYFAPMTVGLRKFYGIRKFRMFQNAFAELNVHWESLPKVEDSSTKLPSPWTSYTTYRWPAWLDDRTIIAFKNDFDRYNRIVAVDAETGMEKILGYTGSVSSRPVLSGGKLWWTEYRSSTLWEEKVNSRLCFFDILSNSKGAHGDRRQIFYPAAVPGEGLAYVVYDYTGSFSIVKGLNGHEWEVGFPTGTEINGLAWDDATEKLYFIGLDDGGMWLGIIDESDASYSRLTPSRHITISDLQARGGKLYFGSIVSGKDEAHCYDLMTGTEYRLTESAYGSFQPFPDSSGSRIALTTYDRDGYKLAVQDISPAVEQEQRTLPVNLVNPDWKRWNLPKMDSLVYTAADEQESEAKYPRPKRFRKGLHLFDFHSWLPMDFYPMKAIDEMELAVNFGATVMSQSLLSDAVTWLSYGWSHRGGSSVNGGFSYSGLGPVLDVEVVWGGGNQLMYTAIPQNVDIKRYFNVDAALSLPMVLGSGYWYKVLTPAIGYSYNNGLIFRPSRDQPAGVLTSGVGKMITSLAYGQQTRMAQKELLPRWGFAANAGYVFNPGDSDFKSLWMAYMRGYLPGFVRHHSTTLRASWQQTVGSDSAPFMFHMKEVFPRGANYNFATKRWASGSVDYQFPVWYPEGGIPSVLYFKRVRLNLFMDYARWQDFHNMWRPLYSYGGDLILDVSPVRMPASSNVSVKFTIAKPSDRRGVWFTAGLNFPL